MKILKSEYIAAFDVDCTIIKPYSECSQEEKDKFPSLLIVTAWGEDRFVELTHITDRIKRHHMQGHHVRIWSAGGVDWAETVVKALHLESYIDEVQTKVRWYYDDLDANEWMKRTIP